MTVHEIVTVFNCWKANQHIKSMTNPKFFRSGLKWAEKLFVHQKRVPPYFYGVL